MKVVEFNKLFSEKYLKWLKDNDLKPYGFEKCRVINGKLYMGVITARNIGYSISTDWVEELHA